MAHFVTVGALVHKQLVVAGAFEQSGNSCHPAQVQGYNEAEAVQEWGLEC